MGTTANGKLKTVLHAEGSINPLVVFCVTQ